MPAHLAADAGTEHLGTTDVDVVLPVALSFDRDDEDQNFCWLETALTDGRFSPETAGSGGGGWRWWGDIDGSPVKIEFLCDVGTDPRNLPLPLPGCHLLSAMNSRGLARPSRTPRCERSRTTPAHESGCVTQV